MAPIFVPTHFHFYLYPQIICTNILLSKKKRKKKNKEKGNLYDKKHALFAMPVGYFYIDILYNNS